MNSTERHGTILQERDRRLFQELAVMRVCDRIQAKITGGFQSDSRTNRRLHALVKAGYLRRFFLGTAAAGRKAIYALTEKSAVVADVPHWGLKRRRDEIVATDFFVQHQLALNGLYCSLKYSPVPVPGVTFHRWMPFFRPLVDHIPLIPDGYVEFGTPSGVLGHFLEVDLGNEAGSVWRVKADRYLKYALSGDSERVIGLRRFRVLVIANSERRMQSIRATVARTIEKIFWFSTLTDTEGDGFFRAVWLRPKGEERQALMPQL